MKVHPPTALEQLREDGYRVQVRHVRPRGLPPKGGSTYVRVGDPLRGWTVEGHARCSVQDNYNRRIGLTIALGRCLKALRAREKEDGLL